MCKILWVYYKKKLRASRTAYFVQHFFSSWQYGLIIDFDIDFLRNDFFVFALAFIIIIIIIIDYNSYFLVR